MTTVNPLLAEYNRTGGPRKGTLASLSESWDCPTLDGLANVTDYVAGNTISFVYQKKVWLRDNLDTTSANDGVTVIVTSDSVRFKCTPVNGAGLLVWPVIDFQNAPPTTSSIGDSYGVGNSPSGAWASFGKAIATCIVGGNTAAQVWAFTPATPGMQAFDKSQGIYRSVTTAVAWIDGLGGIAAAGSVAPEALTVSRFVVQFQSATPPVSPSAGQYFIVSTGATGAWAGHDGNIAKCTNATGPIYSFFTAQSGWEAWNLATLHQMVFGSGAWADEQRPRIVSYPIRLVRGSTIAGAGSSPGQSTPPTNATGALIFPEGTGNVPTYTLAKATNRLIIKPRLELLSSASDTCIAIFIDGQVTCANGNYTCFGIGLTHLNPEFEIAVGDTSAHIYNVRYYDASAETVQRATLQFIEIET